MRLKSLLTVMATCIGLAAPSIVSAQDKPVVGLIIKSLANEFFKDMVEGAQEHNQRLGTYELKSFGMQSETDIESQINAVDNFVTQGVNALVIAPADSRALIQPLKRAVAAGIIVVNIDVQLDPDALKAADVEIPYMGPDNREGARMSGEVLAKDLGAGGKVVIIEGIPGADNAEQRRLGFNDAISNGGLELVASQTAHWETEEANTVFTNILTANPDVQGVMAANDSMALGVVRALDAAGRNDIKVVGFDNIPAIRPLIKDGKVIASVDQFGADQAANAIEAALAVLAGGEPLKGWVKTKLELITKDKLELITKDNVE